MTTFVDTSALIALFDPHDQRGSDARLWLEAHSDEHLVTHNYVVVEALAVLERRFGREHVRMLRGAVFPLVDVHWVSRDQHDRALDAHIDAPRGSSLVDQVSFVVMRDSNVATAFALDEDFSRAGFTTVP